MRTARGACLLLSLDGIDVADAGVIDAKFDEHFSGIVFDLEKSAALVVVGRQADMRTVIFVAVESEIAAGSALAHFDADFTVVVAKQKQAADVEIAGAEINVRLITFAAEQNDGAALLIAA